MELPEWSTNFKLDTTDHETGEDPASSKTVMSCLNSKMKQEIRTKAAFYPLQMAEATDTRTAEFMLREACTVAFRLLETAR